LESIGILSALLWSAGCLACSASCFCRPFRTDPKVTVPIRLVVHLIMYMYRTDYPPTPFFYFIVNYTYFLLVRTSHYTVERDSCSTKSFTELL
jgi:hypothetical protein